MSKLVKQFAEDMRGQKLYKQEGGLSLLCLLHFVKGWFKAYGYISKYYNFDFISFVSFVEGSFGAVFFSHDIYKRTAKSAYDSFIAAAGKSELKELRDYEKAKRSIERLYREYYTSRLQQLNERRILGVLDEILEWVPAILATTVFSESLDEEFARELYREAGGGEDMFPEFLKTGLLVSFDSYASRFDEALLDYIRGINSEETQWMLCDYYVAPAVERTPQLLADIVKQRGGVAIIEKDMERLAQERRQNKEIIDVFRKSLSPKLWGLFEFVRLTVQVRDVRKEYFQKMFTVLSNVSRELFKRQGLPGDSVVYAVTDELVSGEYKKTGYIDKLHEREVGAVLYINNDGWQIECGDTKQAQQELLWLVNGAQLDSAAELKGSTAYPGLVRAGGERRF